MITAIEIPAGVERPAPHGRRQSEQTASAISSSIPPTSAPLWAISAPICRAATALSAAGAASQIIALPVLPPDANGTERKGAFHPRRRWHPHRLVDHLHSGPEGADLRIFLKYTDEKERREAIGKMRVARDLPGVVLNSFQFVQPPELDKPLEFHYNSPPRNTPTRPARSCWSGRALSAPTRRALR